MTGGHWSRRDLAALAPLALSACAPGAAPRPLISVNLLDGGPPLAPLAPGAAAHLESAFDQAARMTVPVRLDGKGPFDFVVDTGANRTVIAADVAVGCGLSPAGRAEVHGIAGVETAEFMSLRRLDVGGVVSRDLTLPVLAHGHLGADGLLGVDVMRGRRMSLDFVDHGFLITASDSGTDVGGGIRLYGDDVGGSRRLHAEDAPVQVPATLRHGQLVIVDAQVADVPVAAFLDSGAQVTVGNRALRDAAVRTRPDFGVRLAPVPLISATGQTTRGEFAPLPTLRMGGMAINDVTGVFADLHIFDLWKLNERPAILIGVDVLQHFRRVTLDFGRKVVVFVPNPAGARRPPLTRPGPF
ncbi:MAG: aspartyl protease family protein [Proteobacteria bacterium]|nr:aspartyl protease family protein [Pseudomonadota bacterium]